MADHGGSLIMFDQIGWRHQGKVKEHQWDSSSIRYSSFVDLLGVLQLLPCEDAEVYHQLTENICAFHCLPSQLAAQLTFELLLHHVID